MSRVTCPRCGGSLDVVKDSRPVEFHGINTIRRRRECANCGAREITYEYTEATIERMRREMAKTMIDLLLKEIVL